MNSIVSHTRVKWVRWGKYVNALENGDEMVIHATVRKKYLDLLP